MTIKKKKKKKIHGEMSEKKLFLPFRQICYFHVSEKKGRKNQKCHFKQIEKIQNDRCGE